VQSINLKLFYQHHVSYTQTKVFICKRSIAVLLCGKKEIPVYR